MNPVMNQQVGAAVIGKTKLNWSHCDIIQALFEAVYMERLHTAERGDLGRRWEALAKTMNANPLFATYNDVQGPALKKAFENIIESFYGERQNLSGKDEDQAKCRDIVMKVGKERENHLAARAAKNEEDERAKAIKNDTMIGFERELMAGAVCQTEDLSVDVGSWVHGCGTTASDPKGPTKFVFIPLFISFVL
jgi:hypothetical protein